MVTAPAVVRHGGGCWLAGGWLPDFVRLGVPTEKVATDWRRGVAPSVPEELFWAAAGPLVFQP